MLLLHFSLWDGLNTRRERRKSLNDMQGNVNLHDQAIIESLSFQR